jgi:hypothetical protein
MKAIETFDQLKILEKEQPIALFIGSAVSRVKPASLPLYKELMKRLVKSLPLDLSASSTDPRYLQAKSLIKQSIDMYLPEEESKKPKNMYLRIEDYPPEVVFAAIDRVLAHWDRDIVQSLIVPLYGRKEPDRFNGNHEAIAQLLIARKIACVLTMNYDGLLEAGCG